MLLNDVIDSYGIFRRELILRDTGQVLQGIDLMLLEMQERSDLLDSNLEFQLLEHSNLANSIFTLELARQYLAEYPNHTNLGYETDYFETEKSNSLSSIFILSFVLAFALVLIAGGLLGLFDSRVRTLRDLARLAPTATVVGATGSLTDAGSQAGFAAVVTGLESRFGTECETVRVTRLSAPAEDLIARLGTESRQLSGQGLGMVACDASSTDFVRGLDASILSLIVIDWGQTTRSQVATIHGYLHTAGATHIAATIVGVPTSELSAVFR
jgi:hypothetical protein